MFSDKSTGCYNLVITGLITIGLDLLCIN